ncbi:pirin family protein [Prevotella sp.]|uniref:pirin family protein n=1 Tax=Prevotella sp. TaxID=59823 RepID=UPI002F937FA9
MEKKIRQVIKTVRGQRTTDGAGVSLVRVLGNDTMYDFDPILMLDSFDSTDPRDFKAGFPTHPHRGIETVTFMAEGSITHRDNLGNKETVGNGEAQWLTAGSGAFHSEYLAADKRLLGLQMWLNMPRKDKMAPPSYHGIHNDKIPTVTFEGGRLRVLTGSFQGHEGFQSPHLPLDYYDITLQPHARLAFDVADDRSVMAFTLQGTAVIGGTKVGEKTAAKLGEGNHITLEAGEKGAEVMIMSSRKLDEPIAWYGPIVMNSMGEIKQTVRELNEGTFLKSKLDYRNK